MWGVGSLFAYLLKGEVRGRFTPAVDLRLETPTRAALVVPEGLRLVFHPNMIGGSRRCSDPGPISLAGSHWIYSSFCAACCEASRFARCCALPIRMDFALPPSPRKV